MWGYRFSRLNFSRSKVLRNASRYIVRASRIMIKISTVEDWYRSFPSDESNASVKMAPIASMSTKRSTINEPKG